MKTILVILLLTAGIKSLAQEPIYRVKNWPLTNIPYQEALSKATEENKLLLLYFTGHACVNNHKMEEYVLSDTSVIRLLKHKVIFVPLFVDETAKASGSSETIGSINAKLQIEKFQNNMQPLLVLLDQYEKIIAMRGYTPLNWDFIDFLNSRE